MTTGHCVQSSSVESLHVGQPWPLILAHPAKLLPSIAQCRFQTGPLPWRMSCAMVLFVRPLPYRSTAFVGVARQWDLQPVVFGRVQRSSASHWDCGSHVRASRVPLSPSLPALPPSPRAASSAFTVPDVFSVIVSRKSPYPCHRDTPSDIIFSNPSPRPPWPSSPPSLPFPSVPAPPPTPLCASTPGGRCRRSARRSPGSGERTPPLLS